MTFDFNKPLLNLKGEEQKQTLGELLADVLSTETSGNAVKLYGWSVKLAKGLPLELDKADRKFLEEYIDKSTRMIVLLRAQLLECLETSVESSVQKRKAPVDVE